MSRRYYPDIPKMSDESREALKSIAEGDEELVVSFGRDPDAEMVWIDDHELCFNLIINDIEVSFWWIVDDYFRAAIFASNPQSEEEKIINQKKLRKLILAEYECYLELKG